MMKIGLLGEKLTIASVPNKQKVSVPNEENSIPYEQEVLRNFEKALTTDTQAWDFERTLSAAASDQDAQMVAVVRNTVSSEASNDNYAPRRIEFVDSDFLLIEPELESESEAA